MPSPIVSRFFRSRRPKLGENWRIMTTIEHMSNGKLCDPNPGLTNLGVRLGYKFNP